MTVIRRNKRTTNPWSVLLTWGCPGMILSGDGVLLEREIDFSNHWSMTMHYSGHRGCYIAQRREPKYQQSGSMRLVLLLTSPISRLQVPSLKSLLLPSFRSPRVLLNFPFNAHPGISTSPHHYDKRPRSSRHIPGHARTPRSGPDGIAV